MAVPKSAVIREYCAPSKKVVIRTIYYVHTLEYFLMLIEVAKKDFPQLQLTPEKIEVVHFGGDRYAKTDGIEFDCESDQVPENYTKIDALELTR